MGEDDPRGGDALVAFDSGPEPDFAAEHDTTNLTGETPGGPERVEEAESPDGLAGMDD